MRSSMSSRYASPVGRYTAPVPVYRGKPCRSRYAARRPHSGCSRRSFSTWRRLASRRASDSWGLGSFFRSSRFWGWSPFHSQYRISPTTGTVRISRVQPSLYELPPGRLLMRKA